MEGVGIASTFKYILYRFVPTLLFKYLLYCFVICH